MRESRSLGRTVTGLLLVTLAVVSCGIAEDVTGEGEPAGAVDEALSKQQSPLRRRWRPWRPPVRADASVPGDATGTGGATGGAAGAGGTGGSGASGGTTGTGGTTVVGGNEPFVSGGRCPNNAPMPAGSPCGPYGVNCTYDAADGTHYCTCLNSGPTGTQGWTCR